MADNLMLAQFGGSDGDTTQNMMLRYAQPTLSPGPAPTGYDKVFDSIYGLLGGTPDKRWAATKLADVATLGGFAPWAGAYDGGRELAETGRPESLAMAILPGASRVAKPALQAAGQGAARLTNALAPSTANPLERAVQAGFEIPEMAAYKAADGRVFQGADHSGAIINAERALGQKVPQGGEVEGFVTSKGRYVTRDEASQMLHGLGLYSPSSVPGIELHSARVRQIRAGHLSKSEQDAFEAALARGPQAAEQGAAKLVDALAPPSIPGFGLVAEGEYPSYHGLMDRMRSGGLQSSRGYEVSVPMPAIRPLQNPSQLEAERLARYVDNPPPRQVNVNEETGIELYRDGDQYYIGDGHHRIEAARRRGETAIDARVRNIFDPKSQQDSALAPQPVPHTVVPPGIKAYHGSPHDFDKFSLDKIGTGEGAQAFGHGIYFAESEGVARSYRDSLSNVEVAGRPFDEREPAHLAAHALLVAAGDRSAAARHLQAEMRNAEASNERGVAQRYLRAKGMLDREEPVPTARSSGHLYEIRINADPNDFLDWDKPLSQQSEKVRGALGYDLSPENAAKAESLAKQLADTYARLGASPDRRPVDPLLIRQTDRLEKQLEAIDPKGLAKTRLDALTGGHEGAKRLRDAGVPGIKYLDQGSRSAGEGSSNFVVFDDALLEILKKYGLMPPAAAGALAASNSDPAEAGQK